MKIKVETLVAKWPRKEDGSNKKSITFQAGDLEGFAYLDVVQRAQAIGAKDLVATYNSDLGKYVFMLPDGNKKLDLTNELFD